MPPFSFLWLRIARRNVATDLDQITAQRRDNAEGFVVRYASGLRVKVKHAEYLRLHRILLGLSNVVVWEQLAAGGGLDAYAGTVPDEWCGWLQATGGGPADALQRGRAGGA